MGYLQTHILEYLTRTGARSVDAIYNAALEEHTVARDTVRHALFRMTRDGLLMRKRRGVYALARGGYAATCDRLLVAGVIDRLETAYGSALRAELIARGWTPCRS